MWQKASRVLGVPSPIPRRGSGPSTTNGVLLYKQITRRPIKDYASPIWKSAARSHVRKLQVLQSKRFHTRTNSHWYFGNRQIHENLGIPFFAHHIRALSSTQSYLMQGTPQFRYLEGTCADRGLKSPTSNRGRQVLQPPEVVPKNSPNSAQ
jgi:hypothetical protein